MITGGAGSAQPPAVSAFVPSSIRRGETKAAQITGTGLNGARVRTSDPGLDIANLGADATRITFDLTATATAALGTQTISIANAGGTTSIAITVNPKLPKLSMSPQPIAVPPTGGARPFLVSLSSPDNVDHVISLASANPAIATVTPSSVTIAAGQTEARVNVAGISAGQTAINLGSPVLGNTSVPVYVTTDFAGITTSFAPLLGVTVQTAPGSTSRTYGPFVSPLVGVAVGAYISGVTPGVLATGSGPSPLVISGQGLEGVTGVSIQPSDGLTVGSISVAPDRRTVTVPVTVAANALTTSRRVVLSGAQARYIPARPGADQFVVVPPPPEIFSIDPIFALPGDLARTLTIQGRTMQGVQSVNITPSTGITLGATPTVNAGGTVVTIVYSVASSAPLGPRVVTVTTLGGASDPTPKGANTFSIVSEKGDTRTPIASALLGVTKADPAPAVPTRSAFASPVGLTVGPVGTALSPAVGIVGTTVNLTIHGVGMQTVTAVEFSPSEGLTVGTPTVSADGRSVQVSVGIALTASQTQRRVTLLSGSTRSLFADPAQALFRVSAPLPELASLSPNVLQMGAPAITLAIAGRNFQNATQVRIEPSAGMTVSTPAVNAQGTQATVTISAAAGTASGPRAVIVATPAGESSAALAGANTLTLAAAGSTLASVTPIVSPSLGVELQSSAAPAPVSVGPIASPAIGVLLQSTPAAAPATDARANQLGVAVGAYARGIQVDPLYPGATGALVVSGYALSDVTAVQVEPASAITLGSLTISPDGAQVSAPISVAGSATAGLRGVRVLRGTAQVPFIPPGTNTFGIGAGALRIDSITPILEYQGNTFTMLIRGANFQGVTAVSATPGTGLTIDTQPSANAAGTEATVRIVIAPDAPVEVPHVIQVVTPAGATRSDPHPSNTFTVFPQGATP